MKPDLPKEEFEAQFEPDGTVPVVGDMVVTYPSTNYLIGSTELYKYKYFHPFRIDFIDDTKAYSDVHKSYLLLADFDPSSQRRKMLANRHDDNDPYRNDAPHRILKRK